MLAVLACLDQWTSWRAGPGSRTSGFHPFARYTVEEGGGWAQTIDICTVRSAQAIGVGCDPASYQAGLAGTLQGQICMWSRTLRTLGTSRTNGITE